MTYKFFALCLALTILLGCNTPPSPSSEPVAASISSPPTIVENQYPEGARIFDITPAESKVQYIVEERFLENVGALIGVDLQPGPARTVGTTRAVSGDFALNFANDGVEVVGGYFEVDILSLSTNQPLRDEAIRSDWLQSNRFPTATFRITGADTSDFSEEGAPYQFLLLGDLTVRDVTLPIALNTVVTLQGDSVSAYAVASLRMTEFGMEPPNMANIVAVEDYFELHIELKAVSR